MAAQEMPGLAMLEEIHHQVMGLCRHSEDLSPGGTVSTIGSQIQTLTIDAQAKYLYYPSPHSMQFEITESGVSTVSEYKVNPTLQTYCCRVWKTMVLISFLLRPCSLPLFLTKGKISKITFSSIPPLTSLQRHMPKLLFILILVPLILPCPWNLTARRQPLTMIMIPTNLKLFLPALNVPLEG
jgi:hypothetical protein